MAAPIPIPSLDPESIPPPDKAIRAVVSLYWPYSSSTRQCALLLADRDFRLRSRRGQVRVRFTSASATAVAQGKVGIGDEVLLDLRGAQWASDSSRVATPGKSVEGELVYKGELSLRIVKKAGCSETVDQHLSVNESTPPPEEQERNAAAKQTPARDTRVSSLRSSYGGVDLVPIYSSPAFVRRQRLSGHGFVRDDAFDPFADIDRELENEQPRKRQRISDVSSWRFAGRSPSPEQQMPVERVSDVMDVDASAVPSGQAEATRAVELVSNGSQPSNESQSSDVGQDIQPPPITADIEDGFKDSGALPSKLSPLQPAASDAEAQDPDARIMLAPPLPQLQMPEDPFTSPSQSTQQGTNVPCDGPSTPKLKAVPGYTLPLPSPFPQETAQLPFESHIAAAQAARRSNAASTANTIDVLESTESDSTFDDGVRLQINPTITALARQREKASKSPRQSSKHTSPASTARYSAQPNTTLREFPGQRALAAHDLLTQTDSSYAEPDVESANDTEEDEEMQHMYSQQAQSHARELLEREGVKTRDWFHREDAAEVIDDMGEEPETSSGEDFEEESEDSEESDEDAEMLSLQGEGEGNVDLMKRPATGVVPEATNVPPRRERATEDDEVLINVVSRSPAQAIAPIGKETFRPASVGQVARSQANAAPKTAAEEKKSSTEPSKDLVPQPRSATPQSQLSSTATASAAPRTLTPKTPAKTLQSLFGFSYGMDGTNDAPPPPITKSTPQSEKERVMKKTYSSLFGFKASPSPENERVPAPALEASKPETVYGTVKDQDKASDRTTDQVSSATEVKFPVPVTTSSPPTVGPVRDPLDKNKTQILERGADSQALHSQGTMNETRLSSILNSTQSHPAVVADIDQFGSLEVQFSEMSQPSESPPGVQETQSEVAGTVSASKHFGSLEVHLSDMSDDEQETDEGLVPEDDAHHSKRAGARAVQEPRLTQATSIATERIKLAAPVDASNVRDVRDVRQATPIVRDDIESASQVVEPDKPFDDEALVESMLNDATPRPTRTTDHDDVAKSQETSPTSTVPRDIESEPVASLSSAARSVAPPSTAPVRSLRSQKIHAPPSSTEPRPSKVEVIDLGSSDGPSDGQSDHDENIAIKDHGQEEGAAVKAQDIEQLTHEDERNAMPPASLASRRPRASQVAFQDLMVDEPEDGAPSYSPTEVASSPGARDNIDVEMQDAASEEQSVAEHQNGPQINENESVISEPRQESFLEDKMEVSDVEAAKSAPSHSQPQSQNSEAPSTQSRNIADHYHYFSFQADDSDTASSSDDDEGGDSDFPSLQMSQSYQTTDVNHAVIKEEANSTAQSEVLEVSSSSPPVTIQPATIHAEVDTTQPKEFLEANQFGREAHEDQSQMQASSAGQSFSAQPDATEMEVHQTPEVQVAASSFVEDSLDHARQPRGQQSLHADMPSPAESRLSQPPTALDPQSQHCIKSQPFETQLPAPAPRPTILPPTPEITDEGLKMALDTPAEEVIPAELPTRKHKRNASSKNISAPVRTSSRKADAQSQTESEAQIITSPQTRSQRTVSPEASRVTARQTRSTATPETLQPANNSFGNTLRTSEPVTPLRRSLRKSQAHKESFDSIEEVTEDNGQAKLASSTSRKLPRKSPELKRKTIGEEDISPPPKRTSTAEKSFDESSEDREPAIHPAPLSSKKTPSKRSFTSRLGNVPEVISAWFSPRRSTRPSREEAKAQVHDPINEKPELLQRTSSNGIMTSSSYYTPLSNLEAKLNPSSQPGVDNTIDVLAVVVDETKAPERAKSGPRDYFTILKIVDPSSIDSKTFTSVDVFRPWHATLPVAKIGDVILLRSFTVKSRRRQPYLLSTDASAWLVWRFDESETAERSGPATTMTTTSPRRTRRSSVVGLGAREETKGPPVEFGDEERQRAKELRAWWLALSPEEKGEVSQ